MTRAKAIVACGGAPPERVRAQLTAQRGGRRYLRQGRRAGGARMLAVGTLKSSEPGRHYRLPNERDYAAVRKAQGRVARVLEDWERGGKQGLCPVPDEQISTNELRRISVPLYGMKTWGDLFTARQKAALLWIALAIRRSGFPELQELFGLALGGVVDRNAALATWRPQGDQEKVEHVFARQALGMSWDFAEAVPISASTGSLDDRIEVLSRTAAALATWSASDAVSRNGQVQLADA